MFNKTPEMIEQAFLWAIIHDNYIINQTDLIEKDFIDEKNILLFKIFKALWDNKLAITPLTYKNFIEKKWLIQKIWYWYLAEIDLMCENFIFWKGYEKIIKENSRQRQIKFIKDNMTDLTMTEDLKKLQLLNNNIDDEQWYNIIALTDKFEEDRDLYKKKWWFWENSPYKIVDKYTWWIKKGFVYTIVAYSNVWKSNFSYSYIVEMLKQWKQVILFSLEVSHNKLFRNILKSYYNKTEYEIMDENFYFDMNLFKNLKIYDKIYDLNEIERITRKNLPDAIYIDFIQNIKTQWNGEYEKMSKVAIDLQLLAIELDIVIFNISQANNDSRFKDWDKITPKWSGWIFASSDIIFALYRDWDLLKLNLAKVKDWIANKTFLINPDFARCNFKIIEEIDNNNKWNFKL